MMIPHVVSPALASSSSLTSCSSTSLLSPGCTTVVDLVYRLQQPDSVSTTSCSQQSTSLRDLDPRSQQQQHPTRRTPTPQRMSKKVVTFAAGCSGGDCCLRHQCQRHAADCDVSCVVMTSSETKRRRESSTDVYAAAKRTRRELTESSNEWLQSCAADIIRPLQSISCNLQWPKRAPVMVSSNTCSDNVTNSTTDDDDDWLFTVIPTDPRSWSRLDVYNWLQLMRRSRDVDVDADRFRMNGKALCLMSRDMFAYRVPHGAGGATLYKDFRWRLYRAVTSQRASAVALAAVDGGH